MTLQLSNRHGRLSQSPIRAMSHECRRLGGINLAQGICDLPLPPLLGEAAAAAIAAGHNLYTRYDGIPELRAAIARRQGRDHGLEMDPENELVVSCGATGAFYVACLALLDPGDEVILFEPYYGYHLSTLHLVQAAPAFVGLDPADNWSFKVEELAAAITPRTRAIMINTPANPCGKVFSRHEIEQIRDLAVAHDLIIFTDEIYEYFIYDDLRHLAPATVEGMAERTVTISGLSKTFHVTGWRLGYLSCRADWAAAMGQLNDQIYVCPPAPLQYAAAEALSKMPADFYSTMRRESEIKRDMLCDALRRAGFPPHVPQGAYYVLADISRLPGRDSWERAMTILHKSGVASVPGSAFFRGRQGEGLSRFCFAMEMDIIEDACRRLVAASF
ncbi:MAG: aminotransferase [Desulfobulbaceae bacterium]|nr:MAG: aminotransferase [Desulfobulbaceae bacterium]